MALLKDTCSAEISLLSSPRRRWTVFNEVNRGKLGNMESDDAGSLVNTSADTSPFRNNRQFWNLEPALVVCGSYF